MNNSDSPNKRRERISRFAPLILWIGLIFLASSGTGSMSSTSRFIGPLLEWLFPQAGAEMLVAVHGYIRKFAHFAEYAALGFWAARAFWKAESETTRRFWFVYGLSLVAATACLDEFNQSFNIQRTSSVFDILLDCAGGLTMLLLCLVYRFKTNSGRDNTASL